MPSAELTRLRELTRKEKDKRAVLAAAIAKRGASIEEIESQIAQARKRGDTNAAAGLTRAIDEQRTFQQNAWTELHEYDRRLRDKFEGLIVGFDPCVTESAIPLVLLPVRLETRFADNNILKVRIYPDTIHVDPLERRLKPEEKDAALAFWNAAWRGDEAAYATAWKVLIGNVGPRRAPWAARATRPTNLAERAQGSAEPSFPEIPDIPSEGPLARLLPDRFVVVAIQGQKRSKAVGKPIKSTVRVGLFADSFDPVLNVNGLPVTQASKWIASYEAALEEGLAVNLTLANDQPIDTLFAYGIRSSFDAAETASELAQLIESRTLLGEFGIVPQATPTNNTEAGTSGWRRDAMNPPPPARDPLLALAADSAGATLANAFGIDPALMTEAENASLSESAAARAVNTILWRATWGTFLDMLPSLGSDGHRLTDLTRENVRDLHRDAVWGRGPLPTIHFVDQPYGVLPVGATEKSWSQSDFAGKLMGLLRNVRVHWRNALSQVERMNPNGNQNTGETLLALLGDQAVSIGVGAREAIGVAQFQVEGGVDEDIDSDMEAEKLIQGLAFEILGPLYSRALPQVKLASGSPKPVRLPLSSADDLIFLSRLVEGKQGGPTSVFQALAAFGWRRANEEVAKASGGGLVANMIADSTLTAEINKSQMTTFFETIGTKSAVEIKSMVQSIRPSVSATASLAALQVEPAQPKSYGELYASATSEVVKVEHANAGLLQLLCGTGETTEIREAIAWLLSSGLDEKDLGLLVGEALDVACHRLDAWITALVEKQRRSMRTTTPGGVTAGAFGWLENIHRNSARGAAQPGFIQAPSVAQAKTAGILRSAYQAHEGASTGSFAIDLSSERVCDALDLIRAMRNGQELSNLIGYRIERALREAPNDLDRFILILRREAPSRQGKLTGRGEPMDAELGNAITAGEVVDGIALIEAWKNADRKQKIATSLRTRPDNSFVVNWPTVSDGDIEAVGNCIAIGAAALMPLQMFCWLNQYINWLREIC